MFGSRVRAEPEKINQGTNEEITVVGYERDNTRLALTVLATVLTGGLLLLLLTWRPSIKLWFTQRTCELHQATCVLCTDIYGQEWEEEVVGPAPAAVQDDPDHQAPTAQQGLPRYFINKSIKYVWDSEALLFTRLRSRESRSTLHSIYYSRFGLSGTEASKLYDLHGENFIKIEVLSVLQIILTQIRNPFYVFQLYTIVLWTIQFYFIFSLCIALLSVLSIACSVWETRRQSITLREKMTSQSEMTVIRNNSKMVVSSRNVVPGDAMVLEPGGTLEVDVLLVEGAVVVTEAMLTGESLPITKVGVAQSEHLQQMLDNQVHKKHILYSGSEVMQVRGSAQVLGVVLNTGFDTVRGELVRSILFPKPIAFHLYSDFLKMLSCFVVLGFGAMGWSIHTWLNSDPPALWQEVVYNSLDLMTFVVPPILPATMTAINVWAQRRLKKLNIFCLSSNYVSLAGPVDVACFDKTGTLTQEDLELAGAVPCSTEGASLDHPVEGLQELSGEHHLLKMALACCHTLTSRSTRDKTFSKNLIGHPMDLQIFSSLNWELEERDDGTINPQYDLLTPVLLRPSNESDQTEVAQLKVFPFDSNEQRMTVVAKVRGSNQFMVLIKGAPEILAEKCDPKSVPSNFDDVLTWYSLQGLRVLGLAGATSRDSWHTLEEQPREELESSCRLLGLVLFHNPLKPETGQALRLLQYAAITTVMITGDNLATAISVARDCGLVKPHQQMVIVRAQLRERNLQQQAVKHLHVTYHSSINSGSGRQHSSEEKSTAIVGDDLAFVMDGHTWQLVREHDRKLLSRLTYKGRVFARMKPDQKVQVIEELRDLGHQVAMCGDGCNDCGALKAAHVGVSLAATEASVAAPFTSTQPSIDCVHALIREGRATLVSTYASFKYNISYGFASLLIVLIHFSIQSEPSDTQYLIMDLVLITLPSLVLGNTAAPDMLVPERPTRRILHPLHISSILSFLAFQALAYWVCWTVTYQQPWFEPYLFIPGRVPVMPSFENTALVIFSFYTFIIAAVTFSHSKPFRKGIITNRILCVYLLLATVCVMVFTFCTNDSFNQAFNFRNLPHQGFRWLLLLGAVVNLTVCYMWERWLLYGVVSNRLLPWASSLLPPRRRHQQLAKELLQDRNWPPTLETDSDRSSINSSPEKAGIDESTYQTEWSDGDTEAQVFMMRKLSRRGKFKATVRYDRERSTDTQRKKGTRPKLIMAEYEAIPSRSAADGNTHLKDSVPEESTTFTDVSDSDGQLGALMPDQMSHVQPLIHQVRDASEYSTPDESYGGRRSPARDNQPILQSFAAVQKIPIPSFSAETNGSTDFTPVSSEPIHQEPVFDDASNGRPGDHSANAPLAASSPRDSRRTS